MSSKDVIRCRMREVLKRMTPSVRMEKSQFLLKQFLSFPEYQNLQKFAVYINLPEEPDTTLIIEKALLDGKSVFVPQVMFNASENYPCMYMRSLKSLKEIELWKPNKWGIKEPDPIPNEELSDIITSQGGLDLLIVPGLAFTSTGHRLGRGGGYYDRYVAWYMKQCHSGVLRRPYLTAFAFSEQIVDYIPSEPHDINIDQLFVA
ncbi:unnamed protein product [Heterobilharzia americana]|nr:unnamed protein product [Heterobilharzia americana]CAH8586937.1 unnamed protein product [Heterobilharzia americana]